MGDNRGMPSVPSWVADAVFYQVFPDRFARSPRVHAPGPLEAWDAPPTLHGFKGGNLPGLTEHLDHLAALGVNAIYLNPVFASASNHRYHTYDYTAVDPLLGGTSALRELLDVAHGRGMRVILDGVFNHSGRGFWPFHHVLEAGAASPYVSWFHVDRDRLAAGIGLDAYPAAQEADEGRGGDGSRSLQALGYRAWWDLPALPKLNVADPELRAYLLGVIETWTRFGIDGWRLDVPEEVEIGFWMEARERAERINPDAYLVGEIWRAAPEWVGSGPFHGVMDYPLAWAILGYAGGASLDPAVVAEQWILRQNLRPLDATGFAERLVERARTYPAGTATGQLTLLGSHDTPRVATLLSGDMASVRLAMLLLLTLPGAPCIYYGDEIGLLGHADPDCRAGFPWERGTWDEATFGLVRDAIALRHGRPALRSTTTEVLTTDGPVCVLARGEGAQRCLVAVNAGSRPASVEVGRAHAGQEPLTILLQSGGVTVDGTADEGGWRLSLDQHSGAVLGGGGA